jgi:hypothetical protein
LFDEFFGSSSVDVAEDGVEEFDGSCTDAVGPLCFSGCRARLDLVGSEPWLVG